jgi:hypothetical protein
VDVARINYRDTQGHFSVLIDDNNRKTVCKFQSKDDKRFLIIGEVTYPIDKIDDVYNYEKELIDTASRFK